MINLSDLAPTPVTLPMINLQYCVEEIRYLTETLESITSKDAAELIGTGTSDDITRAIGIIRNQIAEFFTDHKDALSTVISPEQIRELAPLIARFEQAVGRFEVLADKLITALIAYEGLSESGLVN